MSSSLGRLFKYAKGENDALENFTTEALAQAIRHEPGPFLDAVRAVGVPVPPGELARVAAVTQASVPDGGIVDLIVSVDGPSDSLDIWVEVKRHAPESGKQLASYAAVIAQRPARLRPTLVVLGPNKIKQSAETPFVSWQELWRRARSNEAWTDLRAFLEETRMADRFDTGVTTHEASAQSDAYALIRKIENVAIPVLAHAEQLAPALRWPSRQKQVRRYLSKHFVGWGAMTVGSRLSSRFGVSFGAYPDAETRETWAGMRVWYDHKSPEVRTAVLERAGELPAAFWDRSPADDDGAVLSTYQRIVTFATLHDLTTWFIARLDELENAGLLTTLVAHKTDAPPTDEEDEDEGEAP